MSCKLIAIQSLFVTSQGSFHAERHITSLFHAENNVLRVLIVAKRVDQRVDGRGQNYLFGSSQSSNKHSDRLHHEKSAMQRGENIANALSSPSIVT